ncbi:MAG: hypothetical protein PUG43_00275 [Clostridiales bacterium]|nr:hypothetical protein [Clostridiales bacterium]MDD7346972.1 hypothetical protein [Clostridiales bacterium]MDY4060534.1 hypothetical protein [Anaerovoracaceae bacterium]
MKSTFFRDPDNIVYADINQFAENFGKETGINDLRERIEAFRANPTKEGEVLKGTKRTAIRLLIPDLVFEGEEKIEMGENVWVYLGEMYEVYCLYWPVEGAEGDNAKAD